MVSEKIPMIYSAIAGVMKDLAISGVAKDGKNQAQGYNFRGIDALCNTLAPLLVTHGLLILPRVLSHEVRESKNAKGNVMFSCHLEVEYTFVAVADGSTYVTVMRGEALDSGDKAYGKALSAAYKYMCFQLFCIPVKGADIEDFDHEISERSMPQKSKNNVTLSELLFYADNLGVTPEEKQKWLSWAKVSDVAELSDAHINAIYQRLKQRSNNG